MLVIEALGLLLLVELCQLWRGADSNRRPTGYEPVELPLLHRAKPKNTNLFHL